MVRWAPAVAVTTALGFAASGTNIVDARVASTGDTIELSRDGVSWVDTIDGTLIGDAAALIPGGRTAATLYVRNGSATAAQLRVTASVPGHDTRTPLPLNLNLTIGANDERTRSSTSSLADIASGADLVVDDRIGPSDVRRLDLVATLDADADNTAQAQTVRVDLLIEMAGDAVMLPVITNPIAPTAPTSIAPPVIGTIPRAGSSGIGTLLATATTTIAAGWITHRVVRRRFDALHHGGAHAPAPDHHR